MTRVRAVAGHVDAPIAGGWEVAESAPGSIDDPAALLRAGLTWVSTSVPSTVAATLRAAGAWSLDGSPRRFDASDWWWRVRFPGTIAGEAAPGDEVVLCLDGIATLADVWLNGTRIATTDNMFVAHAIPIEPVAENELVIACRSVDARLAMKRPRPRWKAPMIEHPQLRWIRATLLGRTPGWSPPAAAVGPWRPVRVVRRRGLVLEDVMLRAHVDGPNGVVDLRARVRRAGDEGAAHELELVLERNGREHRAPAKVTGDAIEARLVVPDADRWWPHTHGEPALYRASLREAASAGAFAVDLGAIGFRTVTADTTDGGFALSVNGVPVFCRGACWTPIDPVSLVASPAEVDTAFAQVVEAGMNMLRASGTMVYEDDAFFDAADRAGVLVWQDLMFANMDYPEDDASFSASVRTEVREQLRRLQARPSLAVVCGNSEGEQQAAMWGATRDRWSPALFHATFAELSAEMLPDVPYWPSSAHGGAFPHQADRGTTSYYGVGAYQRPLDDARRSDVRFASECLAFANVPAASTIARMPGGDGLKVHHPSWKARTPRDLGAGWDFDDVRDHYVARMFGVDPGTLRYSDHDRYLALGRVITGEVMAQTFGEWRRARSRCAGGLIWFLRDLWPGAGWGVVGADGAPKAAYHYVKRALAPVALHVSDEGVNGLVIHVANDRPTAIAGELEVALFRGDAKVGGGKGPIECQARGAAEVQLLSLLEGFLDANHAYRFGPPVCDLVHVRLFPGGRSAVAADASIETFAFPLGLPSARVNDVGLTATLAPAADDAFVLDLTTRSFAQSLAIEVPGYSPSDDFFHLAPGASRSVHLRPIPSQKRGKRGYITPLNAHGPTEVVLPE